MDVLATLQAIPGVGPYLPYVTTVIAVGAALAMIVPPPAENSGTAYRVLYSAVNWCALNHGHAANATAPK